VKTGQEEKGMYFMWLKLIRGGGKDNQRRLSVVNRTSPKGKVFHKENLSRIR
jgi:hypothetical protein